LRLRRLCNPVEKWDRRAIALDSPLFFKSTQLSTRNIARRNNGRVQ